jgi:hypothetical protein
MPIRAHCLAAICAVVFAAAMVAAPGAVATEGAKSRAACSDAGIEGGKYVKRQSVGVVRLGSVSCHKAHSLVRGFFRHVNSGGCEGNFCLTDFSGSWTCSFFPITESKEAGGAGAGCFQATTGSKVRMYFSSN